MPDSRDTAEVEADALLDGLRVELESPLPRTLPLGRGSAVFCFGHCFHTERAVAELHILVDGRPHRPAAWRMPRLDLLRSLGIETAYRSGFWTTAPIEAHDGAGAVELHAAVRLAGGRRLVAPLGKIEVIENTAPPTHEGLGERGEPGLIAICMATFDPDPQLLRRQVDSLRAQTDTNWICLISDDHSQPERSEEIRSALADDPRFVLSPSPRRLGFYRNFERALEMVPAEAALVALCDQDDRWYPEKLETLRGALGEARLVYSDQRLVDPEGRVLRETMWKRRRNNHTSLASLLIANTITGAATLFRREVAEIARPFPDTPGLQFHDHWLGLVALATGEVAYVDRPLYDYVQHAGAIFGEVTLESGPRRRSLRRGSIGIRGFFSRWRAAYFYGYLAREVQAQVLLARCAGQITAAKRRALRRFVASGRSPFGFAWLAARPLRSLVGRNETLGSEADLVRGILWRWLVVTRAGRPGSRVGGGHDAGFPSAGPESFTQARLQRWRAGV